MTGHPKLRAEERSIRTLRTSPNVHGFGPGWPAGSEHRAEASADEDNVIERLRAKIPKFNVLRGKHHYQ